MLLYVISKRSRHCLDISPGIFSEVFTPKSLTGAESWIIYTRKSRQRTRLLKNTCNPSQIMWWAPCRRCNPLIQLFQARSLSFVPCLFGCCKVRGRGDHVFRRVRKKTSARLKISRSIRNFLDTAIRIKTAYSPVSLYIADIDRFCKLRCRRGAQYVGKQTVNCVATTSGTKSLSMVTSIKEVGNPWILLN